MERLLDTDATDVSLDGFTTEKPEYCWGRVNAAYVILHVKTGVAYVGSTGNIAHRRTQHLTSLKRGTHLNKNLQRAFNDDQEIKFYYILTDDREQAYDVEQKFLDKPSIFEGLFNIAPNARNAALGIVPTEETRKKLSIAGKARKLTAEHKAKIGRASTGRRHSEEVLKRISDIRKSRPSTSKELEVLKLMSLKISKRVRVGDVVYDSITHASKAHSISGSAAMKRIKSKNPKFSDWVLLD